MKSWGHRLHSEVRRSGLGFSGSLVFIYRMHGGTPQKRCRIRAQSTAGGRTPQVFDDRCARCHEAYSSRGKKGPGLGGLFKQQYLSKSGLPANDEQVGDIIRDGRTDMPAYGEVLTQKQMEDLMAYLHTL